MNKFSAKYKTVGGALLGSAVFIIIYGWDILNPTFIEWSMKGDAPTHFLGWHFFRYEPWRFPLGGIRSYLYPEGTSIVYTDSIPLLALFLKPFSSILPQIFQYHGLWLLLCYVLQGFFAACLIQRKTDKIYLIVLGTCFFVLSPIIVQRSYGQESLSGQWLILVALLLYLKGDTRRCKRNWTFLLLISELVHFYFFLMVLVIFVAWMMKIFSKNRNEKKQFRWFFLGYLTVLVGVVAWQAGYFIKYPNVSSGFGYGEFSMNLLGPINPLENFFFLNPLYHPGTLGQRHEGFNYLGFGVVVLILFACYKFIGDKRNIYGFFQGHAPLIYSMIFFCLLAISTKVTFANTVLFEIRLPEFLSKLLNMIRSSGRMFWPVSYGIILASISIILDKCTVKKSFWILTLCVLLQVIDFLPWYRDIGIGNLTWRNKLQASKWEEILERVKHIAFIPVERNGEDYISFGILAAPKLKTLNVGYTARSGNVKQLLRHREFEESFVKGKMQNDTLYVINKSSYLKKDLQPFFKSTVVDGFSIIYPALGAMKVTN